MAAAGGGFLGLVCTGVWAVDRAPEPTRTEYFIADGSYWPMPSPPDYPFTGAGFMDFEPVREPRLPIPLWLAMPIATTGVGAVAGAMTARAGFRFTRETTG